MVCAIKLTRGLVAFIDDEDYHRVKAFKWHAVADPRRPGKFYASGCVFGENVRLHRFILHAPDGVEVDHADGDGLNDRRANIRLATHSQNATNRPTTAASGYRGVIKDRQRWRAQISIGNRSVRLGLFDDPTAAARAYDAAAKAHQGAFARLNYPTGPGLSQH